MPTNNNKIELYIFVKFSEKNRVFFGPLNFLGKTYLLLREFYTAWFHTATVGAWFLRVPSQKLRLIFLWLKIYLKIVGKILTNLMATSSLFLIFVP